MRSILLTCLLAFPAIIFAQANYQPGFIIKNNGDTVKGYINYREWGYSPTSVEFKTDKSGTEAQRFDPLTIKQFEVSGYDTYVNFVGRVSANKNIFPNLPTGLDTSTTQRGIFLRTITKGKHLTLYYNNEVERNRYFVAENAQVPVELKYYEYLDNTGSHEVVHDLYKGQLILYVNRYNNADTKLINDISTVAFEQQQLKNIIDQLNGGDIAKQDSTQQDAGKRSIARLFIGGGIDFLSTTSHTTINGYKIDAGVDFFINPYIQQFVFRTELSYLAFSGDSYNVGYVTFTPQLIFNFYNKDKIKIYIDGGVALTGSSDHFFGYVPAEVGVVFNRRINISFSFSSFNTSEDYGNTKVSESLGLKILFD